MLPEQTTALTGAVDAATSRLRALQVPEAEIARIRHALLTAGERLDPHMVQPVAPRNFGSRGQTLAQHTALAHERFVAAISTMAGSFESQSDSLHAFTSEMTTRDDETTAHLRSLRAATERIAHPSWHHGSRKADR